jgi:hypothetical protein
MTRSRIGIRASSSVIAGAALLLTGLAVPFGPAAHAASGTTAWSGGAFTVDTPNLVREANIVLQSPNTDPWASMPLGNGSLGAAVWSAGGFTAQLNRTDTFPDRRSPGWLTIPGLSQITNAADFTATVDPYDGTLRESGGGMTATVYVRADKDELVVDVTGANPATAQTARINLWSGRSPVAAASGSIGTLAETWTDNVATTGSGQTFGSLAALTAGGSGVAASVVDSQTVQVSFKPNADGSFRVIAGAPHWNDTNAGDAAATASALVGTDASATSSSLRAAHLAWWHSYWSGLGLVKLSSGDGVANYMEKLRTLYYFTSAEESRGALPGSQAGVADLFSFDQDNHRWYPAAYWFWNLRGQVAANIGAGASALNAPLYNLYTSNLANIQAWTTKYMGGRSGICVPETMRFNGNGFQDDGNPFGDASCDQNNPPGPTWNGETVSTGAEIALWVWEQYQTTGDVSFLRQNYPLMQQECVFLLAYTTVGSDGLRHAVANVHENQWDVQDPVNLIDAMKALFPVTITAAQTLGVDGSLVSQLQGAEKQIPDFPRTDAATHQQLLTASADSSGTDVLGQSSQPTAAVNNSENDDLEAVWPYNLIGDSSPLLALAQRTYTHRVNTQANDWSFDAVQAARLDLPAEVATDLSALTKHYQTHPDGLGDLWGSTSGSSDTYIEQEANVALAINESLVQDYDGVLRIAPSLPAGWDADGTAYIHGGSTASVQVHGGVIGTVGIHAGSTGGISVRNPWPGQSVEVVDGGDETTVVVSPTTAGQFSIPATAGRTYLVQPVSAPVSSMTFAAVTGTPATAPSALGGSAVLGTAKGSLSGTHVLSTGGQAIDDPGWSKNTVQLISWQINGGANQSWVLTQQSDGSYEIKNAYSGLCADDYGGMTTAGTQVIQYSCTGHSNQHWIATLLASGAYTFTNVNSGLLLTTASTANGATVTQQPDTGTALQQWTIR